MKVHRYGGASYTIKDYSLIKKFMNEFGEADWRQMVYEWCMRNKLEKAVKLGSFYMNRYKLFEFIQQTQDNKDYGWD